MNPKVSVVVAVYNVSNFIEQCVHSLFGQTLDDMEFIFVDDGSSDGSIEAVKRVLAEYPHRKDQVKMLFHKENQGVAATKNEGIQNATGEYLIIADPDDFVELNMMEILYRKAVETGAEMVLCDYYKFGAGETTIKSPIKIDNNEQADVSSIKDDLINRRRHPFFWVRLIHRSLFYKEVSAWPKGRYAEDIVYGTVTAYYAQKIAYVDIPLYHYRLHDSSLAHSSDEKRCLARYYGSIENVNIVEDFLKRVGVSEKYWKGILIHKVRARNQLLPIVNKWSYRKLWFKTYPEINKMLFFGDKRYKSSYRERIWFIVIALGLYPYCKKSLREKKLRPFPQWSVW